MSEHFLPIAIASEEEWQASIHYADEHEAEYGVQRAPHSDLGAFLFTMAGGMNRALAEQARKERP